VEFQIHEKFTGSLLAGGAANCYDLEFKICCQQSGWFQNRSETLLRKRLKNDVVLKPM